MILDSSEKAKRSQQIKNLVIPFLQLAGWVTLVYFILIGNGIWVVYAGVGIFELVLAYIDSYKRDIETLQGLILIFLVSPFRFIFQLITCIRYFIEASGDDFGSDIGQIGKYNRSSFSSKLVYVCFTTFYESARARRKQREFEKTLQENRSSDWYQDYQEATRKRLEEEKKQKDVIEQSVEPEIKEQAIQTEIVNNIVIESKEVEEVKIETIRKQFTGEGKVKIGAFYNLYADHVDYCAREKGLINKRASGKATLCVDGKVVDGDPASKVVELNLTNKKHLISISGNVKAEHRGEKIKHDFYERTTITINDDSCIYLALIFNYEMGFTISGKSYGSDSHATEKRYSIEFKIVSEELFKELGGK